MAIRILGCDYRERGRKTVLGSRKRFRRERAPASAPSSTVCIRPHLTNALHR